MPVFTQYDDHFDPRTHERLGCRLYSYKNTEGTKAAIGVGIAFLVFCGISAWLLLQQEEIYKLFGVFLACLSAALLLIAIFVFIFAGRAVHVYERGIEKVTKTKRKFTLFDDVTKFKVLQFSRNGIRSKGVTLWSPNGKFGFGDNNGFWDQSGKHKADDAIRLIVSKLPPSAAEQVTASR